MPVFMPYLIYYFGEKLSFLHLPGVPPKFICKYRIMYHFPLILLLIANLRADLAPRYSVSNMPILNPLFKSIFLPGHFIHRETIKWINLDKQCPNTIGSSCNLSTLEFIDSP